MGKLWALCPRPLKTWNWPWFLLPHCCPLPPLFEVPTTKAFFYIQVCEDSFLKQKKRQRSIVLFGAIVCHLSVFKVASRNVAVKTILYALCITCLSFIHHSGVMYLYINSLGYFLNVVSDVSSVPSAHA